MDLPFSVVYRLSPLTYAVGRPFVSVPHYAMPNLIAGREVGQGADSRGLPSRDGGRRDPGLLEDEGRRVALRTGLAEVRARLGLRGLRASGEVVARLLDSPKKD